ncbi:unnamed protein product, partial [Rotaria sordida]
MLSTLGTSLLPLSSTTEQSAPTAGTVRTSTGATHICPLEEGMGQPQYLSTPIINGAHFPSSPNINPGGEGVTFTSTTAEIAIELAPSITPIVEYVSIADEKITNVKRVSVTILASNGSTIQTIDSPPGSTVVTGFPDTPLPADSTLLIAFQAVDKAPPRSITLSIIACFHPELTRTATSTTPHYSITKSMDSPQYINNPIIIGASSLTSPSKINPGSDGVDF